MSICDHDYTLRLPEQTDHPEMVAEEVVIEEPTNQDFSNGEILGEEYIIVDEDAIEEHGDWEAEGVSTDDLARHRIISDDFEREENVVAEEGFSRSQHLVGDVLETRMINQPMIWTQARAAPTEVFEQSNEAGHYKFEPHSVIRDQWIREPAPNLRRLPQYFPLVEGRVTIRVYEFRFLMDIPLGNYRWQFRERVIGKRSQRYKHSWFSFIYQTTFEEQGYRKHTTIRTFVEPSRRWTYEKDFLHADIDGEYYYNPDPLRPAPGFSGAPPAALRMKYAAQRIDSHKYRAQRAVANSTAAMDSACCKRCKMRFFLPFNHLKARVSYSLPLGQYALPTPYFRCPVCARNTEIIL